MGRDGHSFGKWIGAIGVVCLGVLGLASGRLNGDAAWVAARPDYAWAWPQDHWAHNDYKTEWWYFTGHLDAETGERFGYQFTFFRVGLTPEKTQGAAAWRARSLVMGHAALIPLPRPEGEKGGRGEPGTSPPGPRAGHRFSEVLYRASPLMGGFGSYPDTVIAWSRGPAGTAGDWRLTWNGAAFDFEMADDATGIAFTLSTRPKKALIFQGPNGYSRKGEGATAASQYYSFTRLSTDGRVTVDGTTYAVTGESWMDKEFGSNQLSDTQVGWDWFSLQLDDGRELMLYVLRDKAGRTDYASGTLVDAAGETRYLGQDQFRIDVEAHWQSEGSAARYPAEWRVTVPSESLELDITPELADQENRSRLIPSMRYWEGAVEVRDADGKAVGKGFVEMTGYGDSSRPAI